jgi:rfaE bifunctional protein kinase chain/domain
MTPQRILELAQGFKRQRIVVIGDVMLDHYINGDVRRISPEAPVPIVEFHAQNYLPGGAANVARNLATLGARVELFGVVGVDENAGILRSALRADKIQFAGLTADSGRPTSVKTRVMASHQQILRVDRESRQPLAGVIQSIMLATVRRAARGARAIIVADYAKGVIDQKTISAILAIGRTAGVPVCVDPKPVRALRMKGCALLTPNRKETFELAGLPDEAVGLKPASHAGLKRAIAKIQQSYRPKTLLVTLGEAGMLLIDGKKPARHLPTAARAVFDVSGAGDTVIAAYVLARSAGAEPVEAATLANLAAGVVVGKLGAAAVTAQELAEWAEASHLTIADQ